jgi:hypothetical protein
MVVQLIYQWPIVSGPFGYVLSNLGNGTTEVMGVAAFCCRSSSSLNNDYRTPTSSTGSPPGHCAAT